MSCPWGQTVGSWRHLHFTAWCEVVSYLKLFQVSVKWMLSQLSCLPLLYLLLFLLLSYESCKSIRVLLYTLELVPLLLAVRFHLPCRTFLVVLRFPILHQGRSYRVQRRRILISWVMVFLWGQFLMKILGVLELKLRAKGVSLDSKFIFFRYALHVDWFPKLWLRVH